MHSERAKRLMDLGVGGTLFALSLPVQALVALAVRRDSPGPVFHRATRAGLGGAPFTIYKYRTMVVDAATRGPGITGAGDPRVTRVGRLLRKSKLDELPQLWNVLRGDMSLIGPRPEDLRFVRLYTADQRRVLGVKPGITGMTQLAYRNEEALLAGANPESVYIEEVMPHKLAIDLQYIEHQSLWGDVRILFSTLCAVIA